MARSRNSRFLTNERLCYKAINGNFLRYSNFNGKEAIFGGEWISDFTDQAEITITMPPSMLVSINLMTTYIHCRLLLLFLVQFSLFHRLY